MILHCCLQVPEGWITRRKGDKAQASGVIFVCGDFRKAMTLSVELIDVKNLFKQAGEDQQQYS
jgi:hypothetical protein